MSSEQEQLAMARILIAHAKQNPLPRKPPISRCPAATPLSGKKSPALQPNLTFLIVPSLSTCTFNLEKTQTVSGTTPLFRQGNAPRQPPEDSEAQLSKWVPLEA
jgi:hypothetical protein